MIKAIDADRDRLDEVQDRIIWIAARRIAISGGATQGERMEDGLLEEEQAALQNEERELRAALEDAGAQTRTVEERARERLAQTEALEVNTIKTAAADETASEICSCTQVWTERRVREQIEDAQDRVQPPFRRGSRGPRL